ncbi:MAG: phosphatidate cytidylyltransferase [Lachnospiraceae bacterium]|nr:phosphatidate cytidylyltransferase [Lachnospiraceae bacterium]
MFRTRLLSGIVLVVLALIFIIYGGSLLLLVLGIVSLIGMFELYRVFKVETSIGIVGYAAAVVYYLNMQFHFLPDVMLLIMAFLLVCMCCFVFGYPRFRISQIMAVFFGFFYVAVMISCIYLTRSLGNGTYLVWLIFLSAWGCDTSAYCFGMLFGKHKMTPKLSPKKTVEGAVGGVVGAFVLTIIYGFIFKNWMGADVSYIMLMAVVAIPGALVAMVGDLAASAIKRNYDVKDFGKLIPGHGGILDRFDSVIFTAPIIYYLSLYLFNR